MSDPFFHSALFDAKLRAIVHTEALTSSESIKAAEGEEVGPAVRWLPGESPALCHLQSAQMHSFVHLLLDPVPLCVLD